VCARLDIAAPKLSRPCISHFGRARTPLRAGSRLRGRGGLERSPGPTAWRVLKYKAYGRLVLYDTGVEKLFGATAPAGRDRRARRVGVCPHRLPRNRTRSRTGALGNRALPSDKIKRLQFISNALPVHISLSASAFIRTYLRLNPNSVFRLEFLATKSTKRHKNAEAPFCVSLCFLWPLGLEART